ncbi:cytochrome b [Paucibacter sp. B2R-40]|uniref:cytochrome b n=1 Tax=Paucibacter sp. B2R-40 TaxID=2893554 RepID=UPI0021E44AA0|nr:cytochrome b [Paucibacter sp. B2R-40]MCV2352950.1 cytochrome b [Paucibacter sp. B2R-40]
MDTAAKLSPASVALHWLVGLGMIALTAVGLYMSNAEVWVLYPIHKSVGVLMFVLILARVVWRVKNGWPAQLAGGSPLEHRMAKLVHWLLITATLLMPISGMMNSGAGGHGIAVFGLQIVPSQHSADKPNEALPYNESVAEFGEAMHEWIGYLLILALLLHVAGALKHHLVYKDGVLRRMLGQRIAAK